VKKPKTHYTPEEKVAILRRHLLDKEPISKLCDELGLLPTVFYRWQKEFFENGAAAFQTKGRLQEGKAAGGQSRPGWDGGWSEPLLMSGLHGLDLAWPGLVFGKCRLEFDCSCQSSLIGTVLAGQPAPSGFGPLCYTQAVSRLAGLPITHSSAWPWSQFPTMNVWVMYYLLFLSYAAAHHVRSAPWNHGLHQSSKTAGSQCAARTHAPASVAGRGTSVSP
jgi:hypothetical protein